MEEKKKVKDFGQVFTPKELVEDILNAAGYEGEKILRKHVIDNSCGDGAFLTAFVERYIQAYIRKKGSTKKINKDLETYIHGIEIDEEIYKECIKNLNNVVNKYNIKGVKWDILNENTLNVTKYDGQMDYVIGNPPYVRVHNLNEQYKNVKQYDFCSDGMTDLYIVFYEIGLKMLNKNGVLCYITPNSFYNSLAGEKLRNYIKANRNMEKVMDLGHYQPFSVTAYTTICKICNNKSFKSCKYYKYNLETKKTEYICDIKYDDLFINNIIILTTNNKKYEKYLNYKLTDNPKVQVKNGFATLNDDVFIQDSFDLKDNVIEVIKASTGKWKKCVFPYDNNGNLIKFHELGEETQDYFDENKKELIKRDSDSEWYAFGRSQAIHDVSKAKISINTTIRDIDTIKLNQIEPGAGIYSGLYLLTSVPFEVIREKICSQDFIEYLHVINKCKSGGYFTFSSKDLSRYINCRIEEETMTNEQFLDKIKEAFYKYLETHPNSNEKLRILHGAISKDIIERLGDEYKIHSLGYGNNREICMQGRYINKRVDIGIKKDNDVIAALALKFVMSNYSQNSNNYFENMLGETANIRSTGKPYFQIIILPSKVPYYEDGGIISRIETITEHHLSKYIKLSSDNVENMHTPNKTLLYLVDMPEIPDTVHNKREYVEYFQKNHDFKLKENKHAYEFGNTVVYNDYNKFIDEVCREIKEG